MASKFKKGSKVFYKDFSNNILEAKIVDVQEKTPTQEELLTLDVKTADGVIRHEGVKEGSDVHCWNEDKVNLGYVEPVKEKKVKAKKSKKK